MLMAILSVPNGLVWGLMPRGAGESVSASCWVSALILLNCRGRDGPRGPKPLTARLVGPSRSTTPLLAVKRPPDDVRRVRHRFPRGLHPRACGVRDHARSSQASPRPARTAPLRRSPVEPGPPSRRRTPSAGTPASRRTSWRSRI